MGVNKVKNQVRKAKKITNPKDIEYILSMTSEQCAEKQTIMELFAVRLKKIKGLYLSCCEKMAN